MKKIICLLITMTSLHGWAQLNAHVPISTIDTAERSLAWELDIYPITRSKYKIVIRSSLNWRGCYMGTAKMPNGKAPGLIATAIVVSQEGVKLVGDKRTVIERKNTPYRSKLSDITYLVQARSITYTKYVKITTPGAKEIEILLSALNAGGEQILPADKRRIVAVVGEY